MSIVADLLIGILVLFSVRRLLWVMASWLRRRTLTETGRWPEVLIAVAFRNEQDSLPCLLSSLDALKYDAERLSICLVDDASTDASTDLAETWARERAHVRLKILDENVGKAEALNRALASAACRPEVMVVYDADQCPCPDSLHRLIEPFADSRTEAVCGYRRPVFRKINAIVAYVCLEAWTHQLVNLAAKEALGLDTPTMGGNCAYRRSALERIGGFPAGSLSEDTEVSLALAGSGGRTRFVRGAVADHAVADSFRHYLNQRLRWSRGLMASRRHVRGLETAVGARYLAVLPGVKRPAVPRRPGPQNLQFLVSRTAARHCRHAEQRLAAESLECCALHFLDDLALRALAHAFGIADVMHRVAFGLKLDALKLAGKETARPLARRDRLRTVLPDGREDNEPGQVVRLGAEAVESFSRENDHLAPFEGGHGVRGAAHGHDIGPVQLQAEGQDLASILVVLDDQDLQARERKHTLAHTLHYSNARAMASRPGTCIFAGA